MPTIVCRQCKEPISTRARACPHCGTKPIRLWHKAGIALGVLVLLAIPVMFVKAGLKKPPKVEPTAEQLAAVEQERSETEADVRRVCILRNAQKNAEAFQLMKAVRTPDGDLCVHFTLPNALGGPRAERWIVPSNQSTPQRTSTCEGLRGQEKTAVILRGLRACET